MQFHILDENYIPVAVMDNELPESIHYQKSKFHQFLTGSANFFDFETSKLHVDSDKFQVGYWIAFRYDDRDRLLYIDNIAEAERDKMMTISSISDNLDLNNETIQPFAAPEAKPFKWYFDKIMFDTGYEIGINEISNLTRKLSWDSEMTIRNFIQSVATQFDNAELDYEVQLNSDFTVKKRLIHIKKKIGEVRDDIELRYNENIKTIKRTTSTSGLYTAIRPVSRDNNDKIIDISSMPDWEKKDENGNVKFFHKKGSTLIFAPQANARFGNRGANITGGGYIVYDFSHDNISQSELFNRAAKYLEDHSVPAVNYLAEGKTDAKIGDTVKMVNDGYTPQLLTSARVLEKVASFDDDSIERAEFGNYKALQSQISADLIAKMQQLAEENAPYKVVTLTTNGLTFKNSEGSTTLTARLYKGSKEIAPEKYEWTIDGVVISGSSDQHEITAEDIDGKAIVRWSAVINSVVVAIDEVTIIDVSDGKHGIDGKTYYTHTAYAYSSDGTDRFMNVYPTLNLLSNSLFTDPIKTYPDSNSAFYGLQSSVVGSEYVPSTSNRDLTINSLYVAGLELPIGAYTSSITIANNSETVATVNLIMIKGTADTDISPVVNGNSVPWWFTAFGNPGVTINIPANSTARYTFTFKAKSTNNTGSGRDQFIVFRETTSIPVTRFSKPKLEIGSTATPWIPSSSEVKTSDYPSYIGTYSDTNVNGSTDHSKYTWTVFKGADGRGVSSVAQKWLVQSSSIKPNYVWTDSMWQTTLPAMSATNKYLYTIERTTYTDTTTSDVITLSAIYGDKGDQGNPGSPGAPGSNGKDAITIVLSNENVTLPANSLGVVTSYANSNTTIGVTYGSGADLTPVASGATLTNNQYKVTAAASGITAGTQSVDVDNKKVNFSIASGMNETSGAVASITYTISIRNSAGVTSTVTKVQNFTKAEKGITGDKGIDSYTYIRYSASSNGASMTNLPGADSLYIGTCTTTQATAPTEAGSYVWAKFVGEDGAKGDPTGITQSMTEPITRYTGMLWQYTGADNLVATGITALPNSLYVWTGSAWQLYLVKSTNLQVDNGFITNAMIGDAQIESAKIKSLDAWKINADSLEALSAKIGKISNTFDNSSGGIDNKGEIAIEDSVKVVYYNANTRTTIDLVTSTSGQGLFAQYLPDKNDTTKFQQAWYTPSYLYFSDSINNWTGQITAENVTLVPWTDLTYLSGYTTAENNPCQYRKIRNLDGSYKVEFRGQVKLVSGNFPTSNFQAIANLPVGVRPNTNKFATAVGDVTGSQTIRIGALTDGNIQIGVRGTATAYVAIDSLGYVI